MDIPNSKKEFHEFMEHEPTPMEKELLFLGRTEEWKEGYLVGYLCSLRDSRFKIMEIINEFMEDVKDGK